MKKNCPFCHKPVTIIKGTEKTEADDTAGRTKDHKRVVKGKRVDCPGSGRRI